MTTAMNQLRLSLARIIAPRGADIHDPDTTACPTEWAVLQAAQAWDLEPDSTGRVLMDVTDTAGYAEEVGWINLTSDHNDVSLYQLTASGQAQLSRVQALGV